jgi:hypothetical protein
MRLAVEVGMQPGNDEEGCSRGNSMRRGTAVDQAQAIARTFVAAAAGF